MSREKVYALNNITSPSRPVIFNPEICVGCNNCVEICQVDVFIPNPEKVSKLLAKSFYKEMSKLGFQANHIIYAASEIITQLSISLEKHKKRIERNSR